MRLLDAPVGATFGLAMAGDIGIIGSARERARREGYDAVLAPLMAPLRAADLAFANLEMPVGEPGWVRPNRSSEFWHEGEVVPALVRAGVGVVSLANNHMMDCGERGLERTREVCAAGGVAAVGAGPDLDAARTPAILERGGRRVVVLAYGATAGDGAGPGRPGIAPLEAETMLEDVARWRPDADLLVVSAHWGSMYVDYPPPRVIALARQLIDAGVDVVAGHHPHVMQGWVREGRSLVLFSLGDTAFNCRAGDFHSSVGAGVRLDAGVFTARLAPPAPPGLDLEPFVLDDDGLPAPAPAERAGRSRARLESLSQGLDAAAARFQRESAPALLRYELEALGHYVRQGRVDRIAKLFGTLRPRHLLLLWHAIRRKTRSA